jgi:hypothetical protein
MGGRRQMGRSLPSLETFYQCIRTSVSILRRSYLLWSGNHIVSDTSRSLLVQKLVELEQYMGLVDGLSWFFLYVPTQQWH